MDFIKFRHLEAFTLAEVLISLVILGVVAAFTLPTIFHGRVDESYIGMVKKFETIMQRILNETSVNGTAVEMWGWNDPNGADHIMSDYILRKLSVVKYCSVNSGEGCGTEYYNIDKEQQGNWDSDTSMAKAIITDGISMGLKIENACSENVPQDTLCATVMADINGPKNPNKIGRDIYYFGIYANGLFMPIGYDKTEEEINNECKYGSSGKTCAAKIMYDNWTFKKTAPDIYPW